MGKNIKSPKINKYLESPIGMSDSSALLFEQPALTGEHCGDLLTVSSSTLVNSIDQIAAKDEQLFAGWFGHLERQRSTGQKRRLIFPKNYGKLAKWLTPECNCNDAAIGGMLKNHKTPWDGFLAVMNAMTAVAQDIEIQFRV